ncbi:MAG: YibE/F family protein, partial [Pseudomonadota bacterium]
MHPIRRRAVFSAVFAAMVMVLFGRTVAAMTGPSVENWSEGALEEIRQAPLADLYPQDEYMRGEVISIVEERTENVDGMEQTTQVSRVRILEGNEAGKEVLITQGGAGSGLVKGDKVVVTKVTIDGTSNYYVSDRYRLVPVALILAAFFLLAAFFGRRHGVMSILGLAFSIFVIAKFIVPNIIAGVDPLTVTLIGAGMIMVVSLFLAHGFNRRTVLSLASTAFTLGIAAVLSVVFVNMSKLLGLGSEEAAYLQLGPLQLVNLKGLLLGGIIIGTLGVLDDVTTAQTAAVDEIGKADPSLGADELYRRGLSVGREHIASLVNTLALAYAGASLPLFLMFTVNMTQPFWVILNSEMIVEELVRTLVGSTALILAVPVSTYIAARAYGARPQSGR